MAETFAKTSVSISSELIAHVQHLYAMAVEQRARRGGLQSRVPAPQRMEPYYTSLAIPAYILAPAAVEAFLNEVFLSELALVALGQRALSALSGEARPMIRPDATEALEKLDLPQKLIEVPRAVLGQALEPGQQPHQDMQLLTQLRNALVHYKMGGEATKVCEGSCAAPSCFPCPTGAGGRWPAPVGKPREYARRHSVGAQHGMCNSNRPAESDTR